MKNLCEELTVKDKKENRRHTSVLQDFLTQYLAVRTSRKIQELVGGAINIVQSFSVKGHPYDNAVMECFFKYLKKEETNRRTYSSFDELKLSIFQYTHGFYNSFRPHSHNKLFLPIRQKWTFCKFSLFTCTLYWL